MTDTDDYHRPPARPRLPEISLPAADGDREHPLRAHRRGTVLVLLGDGVRDGDTDWLRRLVAHETELAGWYGRVLVVAGVADAGQARELAAAGVAFPIVVDAAARVATAAGVAAPALVVADQWGEVHVAEHVADDDAWMAPAEVEQWLRTIAIRCAG